MTRKPLIGLVLDVQESGSFSKRPYHALRVGYFEAIVAAGGLPVALPQLAAELPDYLDLIDGLVVPGGTYAFPDAWYVDPDEPRPYADSRRLDFDLAALRLALERDLPMLGICAGMQELACICGAKITRNVQKAYATSIDHISGRPAEEYAHDVAIESGSQLARIAGVRSIPVNTAHREAVVSIPSGVRVTARAPDGVIEAVELDGHRFAVGVQWHPEFFTAPGSPHRKLLEALIEVARRQ